MEEAYYEAGRPPWPMAMYVARLLNERGFVMSSVSVVLIQMIGMEYIYEYLINQSSSN